MTSLLMIHEQSVGSMEFFQDSKKGLEEAKIALKKRAKIFIKHGYSDDVETLSIQRVSPGNVDTYDHKNDFPDVFHYTEFDSDEESE